jgi:hypothetical protein
LVTLPEEFVAVKVKVVVTAGEPVALPETDTGPTPGAIDAEVAPVIFQLSVVVPPGLILPGLAVKLLITGFEAGGAAATVTIACRVTVPAEFDAVNV